jgi:hypothetical protein
VIDAAGAIYVIGGHGGDGYGSDFEDVWASSDGGADPDSVEGWSGVRTLGGYSRVLQGTTGVVWGY